MDAQRRLADQRRATLERWSRHLLALGGDAALPDVPPTWAIRPTRVAADVTGGPCGQGDHDVRLWRGMERAENSGASAADLARAAAIDLDAKGPLWSSSAWSAIEVWTEAELCGLHGLWRLASRRGPAPAVERRLAAAIAWHLDHTQPDNATNRPWAAHVFLDHALDSRRDAERAGAARLYAETLVHNAQAQGLADPASRWILVDAGRELARLAATSAG